MSLLTAKILSNPTRKSWSQIYDFSPDDPDTLVSSGRLVALVWLTTQTPEDQDQKQETKEITQTGKEIITKLHTEYFQTPKTSSTPYERLLNAVSNTTQTERANTRTINIKIIAAVLWKDYVYFCISDEGEVWVKKDTNFSKIAQGEGHAVCISGKVSENQIFLIATKDFFQTLNPTTIKSIFLENETVDQIADNLSPLVHRADNPACNAAVIKFKPIQESNGSQEETGQTQQEPQPQKPIIGTLLKKRLEQLAQKLPQENIYIKKASNSKKTALSIGVVLLAILGISIFFGTKQKEVIKKQLAFRQKLNQAQNLYNEALSQNDIDQAQAQEKFEKAKELAEELIQEGSKDKNLESLSQNIKNQEAEILGKVTPSSNIFLDLALLRSGVDAQELEHDSGKLMALDLSSAKIFFISVANKEASTVGGEDKIGEAKTGTLYQDQAYILSDKGVIQIDKKGSAKKVLDKDDEWGNPRKIGVFGGNIYLLTKNMIWRYQVLEEGYSAKQEWLAKDTTIDLSGAIDWTIDGSVWVLKENGEIYKFIRGAKDRFVITGIEEKPTPTAIYTDEDLNSIFLLDKNKGRVIQVEKTGKYKLQYINQDAKNAHDLTVSQKAQKIFLLTNDKILEIPLQK